MVKEDSKKFELIKRDIEAIKNAIGSPPF